MVTDTERNFLIIFHQISPASVDIYLTYAVRLLFIIYLKTLKPKWN